MAVIETEFRRFRQEVREEFDQLRRLIVGKNIVGNWVMQPMACALLNVKPRQLYNIRIHVDKSGKRVGCIRWRKGTGRTVQYHKEDIQNYLNKITVL